MEFKRILCFVKRKDKNGNQVIRRIPWDLIDGPEFMVSPAPVSIIDFKSTSGAVLNDVMDMMVEDSIVEVIDEVIDIQYFQSEEKFYSLFGGVFGYYKNGENVNAEFGF